MVVGGGWWVVDSTDPMDISTDLDGGGLRGNVKGIVPGHGPQIVRHGQSLGLLVEEL